MESFKKIYARAAKRKGSEKTLESLISKPSSKKHILSIADDRFLAEMTRGVFQAGFVWRVIRQKWPGFEDAFKQFDYIELSMLSDEDLETLVKDTRIVRNMQKIVATRDNALFVWDVVKEHGSFAAYLNQWNGSHTINMWAELKRRGSRLGGNTSQYFLRRMGVDAFMLSQDVTQYLIDSGLIDKPATSKAAQKTVQAYFDDLHAASGKSYTELSQIIAYSYGTNYDVKEIEGYKGDEY